MKSRFVVERTVNTWASKSERRENNAAWCNPFHFQIFDTSNRVYVGEPFELGAALEACMKLNQLDEDATSQHDTNSATCHFSSLRDQILGSSPAYQL